MSKYRTMLISLLAVAALALLAACGVNPSPQPAAVATQVQTPEANLAEPAAAQAAVPAVEEAAPTAVPVPTAAPAQEPPTSPPTTGLSQEGPPSPESLEDAFPGRSYSPYVGGSIPTQVFWGDTHVHTSFSMDAGAFGTRTFPADVYRFAKGEELVSATGQPVKLSRPLDFVVLADHTDNLGFFPKLLAGDPEFLAHETGRRWFNDIQVGGQQAVGVALEIINRFSNNIFPPALQSLPGTPAYRSAWDITIRAAEEAHDPGQFSAFIGFEWTSNTGGNNLHRVVIYRDDATRAGQLEPFTVLPPLGSDNPVDLWNWMDNYERKTGGQMLAIAHNGHISNRVMFLLVDSFSGNPIDRGYAQTRRKWEPLYEVTQIKGDGEAHPLLSPADEFADYETWDKGNLNLSVLKESEMLRYEYARSALKLGLQLVKELGVNPYKFGMIGSTDSHTGLATAQEDNFFGKHAGTEPGPERIEHLVLKSDKAEIIGSEQAASGYAGVWARENTSEALFDAMQRRETYATTGSRMTVRFFGGWKFEVDDANSLTPANVGYQKGVPMGGGLRYAPGGKAPSFLVGALKDPIGGNLDRIQIIKG